MSATEVQAAAIHLQEQLAAVQRRAATILSQVDYQAGEINATPNADEVLLARLDAGQKALDMVGQVLDGVGSWLQGLGDGA